jgi:hypothetical protein
MSDADPPPEVAAAAAIVEAFLKGQPPVLAARPQQPAPEPSGRLSDAEYKALSPAAKLDYSRGFDQSQFNKKGATR